MNLPIKNHLIIADAHVHFYDCFDMEQVLDSAFTNFQKEVDNPVKGTWCSAFLFLTETKGENWFGQFFRQAEEGSAPVRGMGKWSLHQTREACSLYARLNDQEGLYIIAGRQIQTKENLEVLALGTIQDWEERAPLDELIGEISRLGALPVIPWGVGKWIGRRGEFIKGLLGKGDLPPFFMGDNRNRPSFWPRPNLFIQAEQKGLSVLPGTDPLPFPSEMWKIGKFGFRLSGSVDPDYPFRDIKKLLFDPMARPQHYGPLENPWRFFWNQVRMNLGKGKPRTTAA
jgi:hypothetical protein